MLLDADSEEEGWEEEDGLLLDAAEDDCILEEAGLLLEPGAEEGAAEDAMELEGMPSLEEEATLLEAGAEEEEGTGTHTPPWQVPLPLSSVRQSIPFGFAV